MQRAAARRASPAAAVTAKSLSSAPSLLSLLCVLSASAAAGHLADITIERRCSSQRRDCSRASSPVVYPRSRGSRTCCRPSGADSLRRRDCPRDAVVAGAVRHPALERQQRSSTWAGHLEPGSSQPPRRGGAPAATAPRSSARRVQTASSRSRSPAAPGRRPRPAPRAAPRAHGARRRGLGCRLAVPYEANAALRGSAGGAVW